MEEGVSIRAIMIGASVLIICIVFGLVMNYYNKAREAANTSSVNMSIESVYSADIEASIVTAKRDGQPLSATQVKNLLNYYKDSERVRININGYKLVTETKASDRLEYINSKDYNNKSKYNNIIYNIDPNSKYTLNIEENENFITYKLTYKK